MIFECVFNSSFSCGYSCHTVGTATALRQPFAIFGWNEIETWIQFHSVKGERRRRPVILWRLPCFEQHTHSHTHKNVIIFLSRRRTQIMGNCLSHRKQQQQITKKIMAWSWRHPISIVIGLNRLNEKQNKKKRGKKSKAWMFSPDK